MTKQPPYVTKLRLSKLCRGIIALAVVKLCLLVAIVADIPLPELRWEKVNAAQNSAVDSEAAQKSAPSSTAALEATPAEGKSQSTTLVMGTPSRSLLAASATKPTGSAAPASAPASTPASTPDPTSGSASAPAEASQTEPQGAAAAAAAARMRPLALPGAQTQPTGSSITMPVSPHTRENASDIPAAPMLASQPALQFDTPEALTATAPASTVAASPTPALTATASANTVSGTSASPSTLSTSPATAEATSLPSSGPALLLASDTTKASAPNAPAAGDNPWWKNMLQLTHLPVPAMGVAQVAHAAALDTPPAPAVQGNTGGSPFTPPAQQVIPKGQDASGAPLPPRASTARPAGTPQLPRPTGANNDMTTAVQPPAPNVDAYTPPEDPNRKQQELARREQEILALKQQMEQRLEELRTAEMRVKGMLKDAKDVEAQKVSGLIAVYANMKPKQAAQTLQSLDERVAVKILTGLTPKQAGEILSYADPKITAKLTELMTRMHMQP